MVFKSVSFFFTPNSVDFSTYKKGDLFNETL